jgi:hypothetical protein
VGATSTHVSLRRQVAELSKIMRSTGASHPQIAATIATRLNINARVAWRLSLGLTQEQVADRYNDRWPGDPPKTGKQISYWERWQGPGSPTSTSARAPSHLNLSRLATLYGCTVDDLLVDRQGIHSHTHTVSDRPETTGYAQRQDRPAASDAEVDTTNRRDMLTGLTAAGIALAGLPSVPQVGIPARIGPEQAAQVRELTQTYRGWIYQHGASGQLENGVVRLLEHATGLISQVSDGSVRQQLLDALADVAELAAYVCRDLGLPEHATQHYLVAFQAAQAAGNQALAGHTVVRMAGHNIELARPQQVLDYLDAARHLDRARGFTHGELSNQYAIQAWALAQAGATQEVHRAVGLAEEQSARADDRGGPDWRVRHVAEAELYSLTGAGYAELSRHHPTHAPEAIRRLTRALDLRGLGVARNATLDTISLAEAHLVAHDLPQAVAATVNAVESAISSSSRRIRGRLGELRQQLQPHIKNTDTAELIASIDALQTKHRAGLTS